MTKPAFHIPSMGDVARARGSTGLTVASTFSGCGGSCLGFEMAGFHVVWANEFLPIARESYAANHPATQLDGRDIATVTAAEILRATKLRRGELDVFNGSPPCQAFSTAGQREKGWGKKREYSNGVKQKNEDLFHEYVRLLDGLQPRAFVAENVAGLVIGTALGYFKEIMRGLERCGYVVRCRLVDAQWLGVPQMRKRSIFVGVRSDLGLEPPFPKPFAHRYTLRDALPNLISARHDTSGDPRFSRGDILHRPSATVMLSPSHFKVTARDDAEWLQEGSNLLEDWKQLRPGAQFPTYKTRRKLHYDRVSPTIVTTPSTTYLPHQPRTFSIAELRTVCGFPADYVLKGTFHEQWARLGNAVPPLMMREIAATLRDGPLASRRRKGWREAR